MPARRRRPALFPPVPIYKVGSTRLPPGMNAQALLYMPCLYGKAAQLLDAFPRRWRDLFNYSIHAFPPQAVLKLPALITKYGRESTFEQLFDRLGVDKASLPK